MNRASPGTVVAALFAVLVGSAGAYTLREYLEGLKKPETVVDETPKDSRMVVPMAAMDLPTGKILSMGDIAIMRMTPEQFKKSKLPSEIMVNPQQIIGRILKESLKRGDPFGPGSLYPEGTIPNVADRLKPGYRAITVPVNRIGVVAGFANPGTIVDVLFRSNSEDEEIPEVTFTAIEAVEVLALGENTFPGSKVAETRNSSIDEASIFVTLAVSPEQTNILKVLEGRGELSLAVRSLEEKAPASATTAERFTLERLLGVTRTRPKKMEVYIGTTRQQLEFEDNQVKVETFAVRPSPSVSSNDKKKPADNADATTAQAPKETSDNPQPPM